MCVLGLRLRPIDRIEYDVTVQISAQQHGVRERVRACAVEITPGMLRVLLWCTHLDAHTVRFALQDGDFHSSKGVIPYGL